MLKGNGFLKYWHGFGGRRWQNAKDLKQEKRGIIRIVRVHSLGLTLKSILSSLLLYLTIFVFMHISIANGITPLKYHQHYVCLIEATVVEVSIVSISMIDTNLLMQGKSKEESTVFVPIEKIRLKVDSILSSRPISENTT